VVAEREGARVELAFEGSPPRPVLRALDADAPIDEAIGASDRDALFARGAALVDELASASVAHRKAALARAAQRAIAKLDRRIEAVRGDLARIDQAHAIAAHASSFVAEASRVPRGAREMTVTDWSTGEPKPLTMKLDPARPAREQLDAAFRRARRLKLGAAVANKRLAEAEAARDRIDAVAKEAAAVALDPERRAESLAALDALVTRARTAAPRDFALAEAAPREKPRGAKPAQAPRKPHRTFVAAHGARVLVGRGGEDNDELTLKIARPHDLWVHAKNRTGAHVIVPLEKNASCPSDLLVDAALLAAHFSDARGEGTVEIQYTPRRYLRKPKGSAPGFVVVDREKVLVLRVVPERLEALLAAELA
jgi:predicted ribosome quality control (RQC) complex YloA/Tae2 family protein